MLELLTTELFGQTAANVSVFAQSFDPGVTVQSDAPFLPALRTAAGWAMALGLIFLVAIIAVGGVLIGTGKITNTPGNQSKGFMVVLFGIIGSAVVAGASAIVFFGTSIALGNAAPPEAAPAAGLISMLGAF
ncbi:hypothetical protein FCK90_08590 [Kocuria coralli]|uniref:Uncharacterized protein n=1 Tax=Kocuria coralli TaxID=1461025 RepID=A0A5J5KWZ7_9MICC|nr:hypothetical protein [Kocuria coralli]KAA9394164.1 hypothetical protein FCK90_08590 [Kocuria coralli]